MRKKQISIGIPVYNVQEAYLKACLESVLKIKSEQIEILVIDDGSTDKSVERCRAYAQADSRVRWIRLEKNQGVSAARNRMIAMAEGEWVFFLDADDLLCSGFCESVLQNGIPEADVVYYNYRIVKTEKEMDIQSVPAPYTALNPHEVKNLCICHLCAVPSQTEHMVLTASVTIKLFRRRFLTEHHLCFIEGLKKSEDRLFLADVLLHQPKVAVSPQVSYLYRMHPASVSRRYHNRMMDITDQYLAHSEAMIQQIFGAEEALQTLYLENRVTMAVLDNIELDIFHRDNPCSRAERKRRFYALLEKEPYKTAIETANFENYILREKRILLHYVRKRNLFMLHLLCRHRRLLQWYSAFLNRFEKLAVYLGSVFSRKIP